MKNLYPVMRVAMMVVLSLCMGLLESMEQVELEQEENSRVPTLSELALQVVVQQSDKRGSKLWDHKAALSDIIYRFYADDPFLYAEYVGLLDLDNEIERIAQVIAQEIAVTPFDRRGGKIVLGTLESHIEKLERIKNLPDKVQSAIWKARK